MKSNSKTKTFENSGVDVQNRKIIFTRVDKENTVIAIDETEYDNKTLDSIETVKFETLRKDPTEKYQKQIKGLIHDSTIFSGY